MVLAISEYQRSQAPPQLDVGAVASALERTHRKVIDRGHRSPAYK